MLVVLTRSGDGISIDLQHHAVRSCPSPTVQDLRSAVDSAPTHREVVIVGSAEDADPLSEHTGLLAELTGTRPVVWSPPTNLLAVLVAARHLDDAGSGGPMALGLLQARVAATYAVTWLRRVNQLRTPAPTVTQHLASWLPGAGFVIEYGSERPKVHGARHRLNPPADAYQAAYAHGEAPTFVTDGFTAACQLPLTALAEAGSLPATDADGSSRQAMFVADPAGVGPPAVVGTCSVCDAAAPTSTCPFCRAAVLPTRGDQP